MAIVGFNFTRMHVERKMLPRGKINIKNNVNISDVVETNLSLGTTRESGLVFKFDFKSVYEPEIADISFSGEILYLDEAKKVKEILDRWKKDRKVDGAILGEIMNSALAKCNVQALILSQELNLPSPIPLPRVSLKKE